MPDFSWKNRGVGAAEERHAFVVRGIGAAGQTVMTMTALKAACHAQGLPGTRNVVGSGNPGMPSDLEAAEVEARFAVAMASGGLTVTRQRQTASAVQDMMVSASSLPELTHASGQRPAGVQLQVLPGVVADTAIDHLRSFARKAMILQAGNGLVIGHGPSIADSALMQPRIDRALGRAQTARNWNTANRIGPML